MKIDINPQLRWAYLWLAVTVSVSEHTPVLAPQTFINTEA